MKLEDLEESDRKIIRHLNSNEGWDESLRKTHTELDNEIDDITTSWISQRLNHLVEEGFLEVEKEGRKKYYTLAESRNKLLRFMTFREDDVEFIRETSVDNINLSSRAYLGAVRPSNFAQYNRVERVNPSEFNLKLSELEQELGKKMTAEEILLFVADKLSHNTEDVRKPLSRRYREMVSEYFEEEEQEKVLEVEENLLDVLLNNTEYLMGGVGADVNMTLPIGSEEVEITGESVSDVYSSVPNNEIFPEVDSERMKDFLHSFEEEVREALKSAIVLRNY